jgi:hypothetical protein
VTGGAHLDFEIARLSLELPDTDSMSTPAGPTDADVAVVAHRHPDADADADVA